MSNLVFEMNGGREVKTPPLNSGVPQGRLVDLSAAAADAQATYERWHAELQSVQGQHRARAQELQQMTRLHEQKTSEVNRLLRLETTLNEHLGKLNGQQEQLLSRLQEINSRYLQDQGRLEQTQQKVSEWESHKQTVEAQVAAASRQLTGLKAESALLDERSSEISDLLQKAIDEVTRQQERIVEARGTVVRQETRQQELTIQIARLEVSIQQTDASLKLKQERLNYLEEAGGRATGHVVDLTSRYQTLEQNFTQLTAQCRESEAALNLTRGAVADERARLQDLRHAVEQTSDHHGHLENAIHSLADQRVAAAAALDELLVEAAQHEQSLVTLRQQRAESQAEMDKLRGFEQAIAQTLLTRRNELARAEEQLGITLNECAEATAQLADLGRSVAELETREATAAQQIHQFTQEMAGLGVKRQQVEQQIVETESTLAALGQQHRTLGEEIVVLLSTRQTASHALQTCRAELSSTEERLQNTQHECQATETRLASLIQTLQAREEEESILGDRIHTLELQSRQLETQTQEQAGKLETLRQERIDAEISLQRLSQQHEEVGIRLETRQTELDTATARLQHTLVECQQAEERRAALNREVDSLAMRQQNQEAILGEIAAQISRREQERETSATAARQALQEHEAAAAIVVTVRKELAEQQAAMTEATAKLSELQSKVQTTEHNLMTTRASLAGQEQKLAETRSALDVVAQELAMAHDIKVTLEILTSRQANVAAAEQHLGILGRQVEESSQRRAQLDTALKDITEQLATATARCDTVSHQETETRERLELMIAQEKDLRQEIVTLTSSAQQERTMYDELRSLSKEARHLHDEESATLAAQIAESRQQISSWESQIAALLDWKERMDGCLNRLQQAEADSPEARSANDEIHMSLGALRHHMERIQSIKQEVALPPASSTSAPVEASPSTKPLKSSAEAKAGSSSQNESKLNSKISRLRDELQREENRLHFLRQNIRSLELRARSRPVMPAASEGQPVQNGSSQEGVSHWAERLKRATLDEQSLLEKIATLRAQIADLRGEVQTQPLVAMSEN
jgi:chromosome segregation ATPase